MRSATSIHRHVRQSFAHSILQWALFLFFLSVIYLPLQAREQDARRRLQGFDQYIEKILKDWNVAGIGVGVIVKDSLVYAKGYGYRDYDKKLPVTPNTLFQIASNTKLFTATAIGMLVQEKKLDWDKPIRNYIPVIQFYDDQLNNTVTIRDMLSHRTGISRHDMIWYQSDFTRKELFERLKYLEPSQPLRQGFLYNNMMYAAAGYIVEILSQKTWEEFVKERIFTPLGMKSSLFTVAEMEAQPDHGVPYNERRDTTILYPIPIYEEAEGVGPAGSIISNIRDMSRWLRTVMNDGVYEGKQIIPESVVQATLAPSIALPNTMMEERGFRELINPTYGMGRWYASYRGHYFAYHGGDLPGFHSQISCMPADSLGAIVFVIGDHGAPLSNVVSYNMYERLLGMDQTPWNERRLEDHRKNKMANKEARLRSGGDRVANTKPSHPLSAYDGIYEHPAYGILTISLKDSNLGFDFHKIRLRLTHYHYDRFDTPNDERYGLFSVNFSTSPQGAVDRAVISLDESEATFIRKPDATLSDPKVLEHYIGKYESAGRTAVITMSSNNLFYSLPGWPQYQLLPLNDRVFRMKEFSDVTLEFVLDDGTTTTLKLIDPSGVYQYEKKR